MKLYSGSDLVGLATGNNNYGTNSFLSITGTAFDHFEIVGTGNYYTIDDLTVDATAPPVPEPATMTALALGLVAVRRRRKA